MTVRFAIIGCGRIAKNHVGPLTELPRMKLVAACDLLPERVQPLAKKCGVPAYTNYHTMLQNESIDVVCVLTPSGMHPFHAIDVMKRYRKHVVIEKPMGLTLSSLDALRKTAKACGVKIFPVYQNRYNKAVRKVREDIRSGRLGKLVSGAIRVRWCRTQKYYDRDPWRGTWAMDGGALTNQGIHYIDLLQYLLGSVESVYCRTATRLVNVQVEDTAAATLSFANGCLGAVEVTTAARPYDFEASISILGEKGTAILTGIAANQLSTYTLDPKAGARYSETFPDAYGYGHWPFFKDVVADLLDHRPHPVSFQEGTHAIRLLNALYRSSEDRTTVFLNKYLSSKRLGRRDRRLEKRYESLPPRT